MYDEDERIAPKVASTFVQRDVENVFMLSGGEWAGPAIHASCLLYKG